MKSATIVLMAVQIKVVARLLEAKAIGSVTKVLSILKLRPGDAK